MASTKWAEGSDALAIPACFECHPQSTKAARDLLVVESGVDLDVLHRQLWSEFLQEHGIHMNRLDGDEWYLYDPTLSEFEILCVEAGLGAFHDGSSRKNRKKFTKGIRA